MVLKSRHIAGSTTFCVPFLKRLLHASGEAVASIYGTAVWQKGACVAVKGLDCGGPASICHL
ncbi:MAG: hypothetical protein B7Y44_09220 [Sphingomonadales bacterium 28-55-16]|nr:MAG: hypothetical protein B7Y44_09220 [Sphingomonadales bacterium 28-55-16]